MRYIILVLILILNGCKSISLDNTTFKYLDYNVNVVYSNSKLKDICFKSNKTLISDDGKVLKKSSARLLGCYSPVDRNIYVLYGQKMFCTLLHELAHKDGIDDPRNDGYEPNILCREI